jgi:tRNA (cytidine32/uridine32-2'-O)-methyltransferase
MRANRIQIVLCGTSHAGNLGAVARAMKNMGLHRLVLVSPKTDIDELALATAKHAADILSTARQVDTLPDALANSVEVWATTARPRELHLPVWSARAAAEAIAAPTATGITSIVFGAERTGLTNQELSWAQRIIEIPANPDYPVLNLGQAVQIVTYEWRMAHEATKNRPEPDIDDLDLATAAEWAAFEHRLAEQLDRTSFFHRNGKAEKDIDANRERLMGRLRVLCRRAHPTRNELAVMQGMLRALTEPTITHTGVDT